MSMTVNARQVLSNMFEGGVHGATIGCGVSIALSTPVMPAIYLGIVVSAVCVATNRVVAQVAKKAFQAMPKWLSSQVETLPGVIVGAGVLKFTAAKLALGVGAAPLAAGVLGVSFVALNLLLLLKPTQALKKGEG